MATTNLSRRMTKMLTAALVTLLAAMSLTLVGNKPAEASFPGNNGKIVFTSNRDGNLEVYTMNADGSGQTNLTNNPADDDTPIFSPDGKKITFASDRDGNFEIYTMNADGSGQTRLTNAPRNDYSPAFSPDGTKIAFTSTRDDVQEVYVMNADGSGQTNLTRNPAFDADPSFSPDGTKIAFWSGRDGNGEVYVMNADGSGQTNLTNNPAVDYFPSFSPGGGKIAFSSNREGNTDVYTMWNDGRFQTRVTNHPAADYDPVYSPDGFSIAFISNRNGRSDVFVDDGFEETALTNNFAFDLSPDWGGAPPPNDDFVDTDALHEDSFGGTRVFGNNFLATREAGEPDHSVWYSWTALRSSPYTIDTCSTNTEMDTVLAIFTGDRLDSLSQIAENNNGCPSGWGSRVTFNAKAGVTYKIVVGGTGSSRQGRFDLNVADTGVKAPTIVSPAGNSYDKDGAFTVRGKAEAHSLVQLVEGTMSKGETWADQSGDWSISLEGVPQGKHVYRATAFDFVGNTSAPSKPLTVVVDRTAPKIRSVSPINLATDVSPAANVTAAFSEAIQASTVNKTTFKLVKKGAATPVAATVSYNATTKKAILNPSRDLVRSATYTATVTRDPRDLAGNPFARNKVWSFTVRR